MKVNPYIFAMLSLFLFFAVIGGARAAGVWTVSGQLSATGEKGSLTTANPDDVKGWMTLGDVAGVFGVPLAEIKAAFSLPPDVPAATAVKDLESETFSVKSLRDWLKARATQ